MRGAGPKDFPPAPVPGGWGVPQADGGFFAEAIRGNAARHRDKPDAQSFIRQAAPGPGPGPRARGVKKEIATGVEGFWLCRPL